MASPIPRPQPPQSRITKTTRKTAAPAPEVTQAEIPPKPKPTGKFSLWRKYSALSFKVKLYIWITTAGAAWLADSLSDKIFEQNMIDAEAHRRVEMELRKMRELEQTERKQ
ncbi:hypothetical protein C6P40_001396 [Pichia californica]|uniref:Uncharacterized protein n=1 Tax=Pichia californica TaxID=460514 RepID=A0A9P6WLA2_9ASCO|nr:hypothetical protein C6P42_001222 [[Candida] californica]KAG0688123.1 hypothetical protein C6P40_001396 [[Candida] californica]